MLKNKIITLDDGSEYYVGEEIKLNSNEYYCCASKYNSDTDDCEDEFYFFKIEENENKELVITPVEDQEMNDYLFSIIKSKNE
jgi:hypothetical protein